MKPFRQHTGRVAPLDRPNVDTDQIIPKQFLKSILRSGLGKGLFFDWRFLPDGSPNPEFILNQPKYQGVSILLARDNFGCGSSREHAPWALKDYGFQVVIAPSFADIFYNNSFKNGMLMIRLSAEQVEELFQKAQSAEGLTLSVDLDQQELSDGKGWSAHFDVDPFRRKCLLEGLDDIGLTLAHEPEITAYEARR